MNQANEEQVSAIMSKVEQALEGLQVHQALAILAGMTGEVLTNLPKNVIPEVRDEYIRMINEVSAMAEDVAQAPTLN